jgi:hypothetical protein
MVQVAPSVNSAEVVAVSDLKVCLDACPLPVRSAEADCLRWRFCLEYRGTVSSSTL